MSWQYDYMSSSSTSYKNASQQNRREKHMEKIEIWLCKICDKEFATKSGLNKHFTMIHEQPKPSRAIQDSRAMVPYRSNTPDISCHICGNSFVSQSNLTRHLNTVHERAPVNNVSSSTKMVQKNKTNVTINMYKPVFYNNNCKHF